MTRGVWKSWIRFALSHAPRKQPLNLEFGVGETFLQYEMFRVVVDRLQREAAGKTAIAITVSTNGVLLDDQRLGQLAGFGVSLDFSIDGPRVTHDACRLTRSGKGSFSKAFKNWQAYRSLVESCAPPPGCAVQSVYNGEAGLHDLTRFWTRHGQPIFSCVVQLPGGSNRGPDLTKWRNRQAAYLADLETHARQEAQRLTIPTFLSEYQGPADLYKMWKQFFLGQPCTVCKAGEDTIAVDTTGDLYPCEAFIGHSRWCIGNVFTGVAQAQQERFVREKTEAEAICRDCADQLICPKSCVAAFPQRSLAASFADGCRFGRKLADIARRSYTLLEESQ